MTRLIVLLAVALLTACTAPATVPSTATSPDPVTADAGTETVTTPTGNDAAEDQAAAGTGNLTPSTPTAATATPTTTPTPALAQPLAPPTTPATPSSPSGQPDGESIPAGAQEAIVTWIIDGDTIDVEVVEPGDVPPGDQRIRLLEIDTPERDDDCYETATDLLADLIPVGSTVFLERDTENLDPNGRYLRYIWSETEGLVNVDMVAEGMAEAFIFPLNRLHEGEILAAEEEAQDLGLGIWGSYCDGRP